MKIATNIANIAIIIIPNKTITNAHDDLSAIFVTNDIVTPASKLQQPETNPAINKASSSSVLSIFVTIKTLTRNPNKLNIHANTNGMIDLTCSSNKCKDLKDEIDVPINDKKIERLTPIYASTCIFQTFVTIFNCVIKRANYDASWRF